MIPRLMKAHYTKVAKPVTTIFNTIFRDLAWPANWKVKTTVVVPKMAVPGTLAECRNISCTNFFSKVLVSIVLQDLRQELMQDLTQYGGIKNCFINHLLIDL